MNTGKEALALVRKGEIYFQPFASGRFVVRFKAKGGTKLERIAAGWGE